MDKRNLVILIHGFCGIAALTGSLIGSGQINVPEQPIKAIGDWIFVVGCLLFIYSLLSLRGAISGTIEPTAGKLVTGGPYQIVRHPLYLAMLLAILGLAVGLRSWLGIALTILAFFPSAVWRAKLEETALSQKFGEDWQAYHRRTHFILPFIY